MSSEVENLLIVEEDNRSESSLNSAQDEDDDGEGDCIPYDDSVAVERIDCTKPAGVGNTVVTSKELVCSEGDGEFIRQLQHALQEAILCKDSARVQEMIHSIRRAGRARNFLAAAGLLQTGERTGWIAEREFDTEFDAPLLADILKFTKIPLGVLKPARLMRASLSISDPLLLITSLDAGAKVTDVAASMPVLKNARARSKSYMLEILEEASLS